MEKECDSKRIESVRVYRPKWTASSSSKQKGKGQRRGWWWWFGVGSGGGGSQRQPIRLYTLGFVVLYCIQISWVVSTVGEPYRIFLEKADREGFQGAFALFLLSSRSLVILLSLWFEQFDRISYHPSLCFFPFSSLLSHSLNILKQSCRGVPDCGPSSSTAWLET